MFLSFLSLFLYKVSAVYKPRVCIEMKCFGPKDHLDCLNERMKYYLSDFCCCYPLDLFKVEVVSLFNQ